MFASIGLTAFVAALALAFARLAVGTVYQFAVIPITREMED